MAGIDCARAAYAQSLRGTALVISVAIAFAEGSASIANSNGTPKVNNNPSTGDYSWGPWQINYYGSLGPERTAKYGPPEGLVDQTIDTNINLAYGYERSAYAMASISNGGTDWSPWSTYKNGAYLGYMLQAAQIVNSLPANGGMNQDPGAAVPVSGAISGIVGVPLPGALGTIDNAAGQASNAVGGVFSGFTSVLDFLNHLGSFLTNPHNIWRIVQVVGGALMMIMGIVFINKDAFDALSQKAPAIAKVAEVAAA